MEKKNYLCPVCSSSNLTLRYEANYIYSYVIDSDAPGLKNTEEFLSFLYDNRELKGDRTYIECNACGTQYPYKFLNGVLDQQNQKERDYIL